MKVTTTTSWVPKRRIDSIFKNPFVTTLNGVQPIDALPKDMVGIKSFPEPSLKEDITNRIYLPYIANGAFRGCTINMRGHALDNNRLDMQVLMQMYLYATRGGILPSSAAKAYKHMDIILSPLFEDFSIIIQGLYHSLSDEEITKLVQL